jgi:hypothetical protein
MFGGTVNMLKYSTYQSIYNHEISGGDHNGGKLKEQLHAFQAMFTRRLMVKLLLIVIIMTAGCTGMVRVFAGSPQDEVQMEQIVVSQGDTLWQIARDHKPKDMDTRAYIQIIKKTNHLKSSGIQAGDVLSLPIY